MFKSGVGGSPFAERNFHPHTTRRFNRRTKEKTMNKQATQINVKTRVRAGLLPAV